MTRSSMRDRDIDEGVRGLARDIYLLSIAVDLMANLFEQLQSVRDDDAALDRDLMIEGHLISARIIEGQEIISQLNFAANGVKDAGLMARARVILGPLGRKLDRLAGYLDRREALLADTLSVESEIFGEWIESPQHSRSH